MIYDIDDQLIGNNPVLAIQSHAHLDSLDAAESSAGLPDWPLLEVTNDYTYGGYTPAAAGPDTAVIAFDFTGPATVNYLALASHNLGTRGCTIRLYLGDAGPVWDAAEVFEIAPLDDSPILVVFPPDTRRWAKIEIDYGSGKFVLGVARIGERLIVPRRIYGGHSPATLSRVTALRPLTSETGQFIGQAAIRHGLRSSFSFQNLDADWYRAHMDPFVERTRFRAFFAAWRPVKFEEEVVFAKVPPGTDIAPSNMGVANLMEVTIPFEAHDWEAAT
jgi:hypothetical protein